MIKWRPAAVLAIGMLTAFLRAQSAPLTSISSIHSLTNEQASHQLPVDFEATVTFYRSYESTLFVQDGDTAVYVQPAKQYDLLPGDRIRIRGITRESFRPFVDQAAIDVLGRAPMPKAAPATFDDLVHARDDCRFVTIKARVLSADITFSSDRRSSTLELMMDGGPVEAQIDRHDSGTLANLLDAEIQIQGAASGRFDGKMQMTGVVLHTENLTFLKILKPPQANAWALPLTPMSEIVSQFSQTNVSRRVHVQGTITYYMPGSALVLEHGRESLWVNTRTRADLRIGDLADATGFPDVHDGFLKLADAEVQGSDHPAPVQPMPVTWDDLTHSHHVFDLVSIEGRMVAEVREAGQDQYVLVSEGHLFTAIYRHPARVSPAQAPPGPMKIIPLGSKVRVDGICILEDSNPFNANVPFDLLLRNFDDIGMIAKPSPLTIKNLVRLVSVLILAFLAVSVWSWMLRRKIHEQTAALATRAEAEAALERRNAQSELRRSRILEDINGTRPLAEVLEEITDFVSFRLNGAPCWCEIADGARLGSFEPANNGRRIASEDIPSRSGPPLGVIHVALDPAMLPSEEEAQSLYQGARLATLAIETRRAYSDLVHRSEFDLLTDAHNRFSLDRQLDLLIGRAREQAGILGLIYVDLDEFKQVNDVYGHRVGDLYLQEASARMKRQLRSGDLLARLGGDEFAAIVPAARGRGDVEEIALRLERGFDEPFRIENYVLHGSASIGIAIYPEDGTTKDSLLTAADAAMYVSKHTRRVG
ncbi:MAG TPA: GGDEF domain-containing protein [Terracidiphilus sp.]|nr:GGDEF domain-containing protein [Terracidiphilus sp.]